MSLRFVLFVVVVSGALFFCGACHSSKSMPGQMLSLPQAKVSSEKLRQRAQEVLVDIMAGSDAALQCHALETLALLKGDPLVAAQIRLGLNHPSVAVRFAAAIGAGDVADYSSKPLLRRLLHEENPSLKMASAYALEKMGDRRFGSWYDDVLKSKDVQLCSQACLLLGKLGTTKLRHDSVDKLRQVLYKKDQAPAVKLQAAESLARLGNMDILTNLLGFATSGYASDRLLAVAGLSWLKEETAQTMLLVLADDEHLEVKLAAIRALGSLADASHLEVVRMNLRYQDPDGDQLSEERIRGLALLALGQVGQPSDARTLYKTMASQSGYSRIAAARATIELLDHVSMSSN